MRPLLIWTYHRILPGPFKGAVDLSSFSGQIECLRKAGYEFVDTNGLKRWLDGELDRSKRYTMLTFDDGWADNLIWASPVLRDAGVKAVMAVNTSLVNPETRDFLIENNPEKFQIVESKKALGDAVYKRDYSSFLSWEELGRVKESGVWDIQAHGNSHLGCYRDLKSVRGFYPEFKHWTMEHALGEPPFHGAPRAEFESILSAPNTVISEDLKLKLKSTDGDVERLKACIECSDALRQTESEDEFKQRVREDLTCCKKLLQEKLDVNAESLFWPWGHFSRLGVDVGRECGYEMFFTMHKDAVTDKTDKTEIPRIAAPESIRRFKKQKTVFSNRLFSKIRKIFS